MQEMIRNNYTSFLGALVLCAFFMLSIAQQAHAAPVNHSNEDSLGDEQSMICEMGECQMEHENCLEHCFNQSNGDDNFVAILSHNQLDPVEVAQVTEPIDVPTFPKEKFLIQASDRAPPALVFLRSVIKIE